MKNSDRTRPELHDASSSKRPRLVQIIQSDASDADEPDADHANNRDVQHRTANSECSARAALATVCRISIMGNKVRRQAPAHAPHLQWPGLADVGPARMQRAHLFDSTAAAGEQEEQDQQDSATTVLACNRVSGIDLMCHESMDGMDRLVPKQPILDGLAGLHRYSSSSALIREISRRHSFSPTCTALAEILLEVWLDKKEEVLDANGIPSELTIATCVSLSYKWLGEYSGTQCTGHDAAAALRHMNHTGAYQEMTNTQVPCSRVFSAIWLVVKNSVYLGEISIHDMHARNKHNGINSNMRFIERKILRAIDWNFRQFDDEVQRRILHSSINAINAINP